MSDEELTSLFRSELEADIPQLAGLLDLKAVKDIKAFAHKYKIRLHYLGFFECYELCLDIECYYKVGNNTNLLDCGCRLLKGLLAIQKKG